MKYSKSKQECDDLKKSPEAPIFIGMHKLGSQIFPMKFQRFIEGNKNDTEKNIDFEGLMLDKFTMVFTNVPGPTNQQCLAGVPIEDIKGSVSCPLGSAVMLSSYKDNMYFSICADIGTGIEAREFVQTFEEEAKTFYVECQEKAENKSNWRGIYALAVLLLVLAIFVYLVIHVENLWMYQNVANIA